MKKTLSLLLALVMLISLLACNSTDPQISVPVSESTVEAEDNTSFDPNSAHTYTEEITVKPRALSEGKKTYTCTNCGETYTETIPATKTLKVLAIGNSFSSDATEYLWNIAMDGGVETIVVGNLYIGGCTLEKHWTNINNSNNAYTYYKNTRGKWTNRASTSVQYALKDEEWDIVTIQQASGSSGMESTYSPLGNIVQFLVKNEPNAEIYWHMTWAYQQDSTHASFPNYGSNQLKMYEKILNALNSKVKLQKSITGIIPAGTAVQNLRSSYIGDTITRDGYHMSHDYGRYTVALTWFAYLTGGDVDQVDWLPADHKETLKPHLPVIREAVRNALANPEEITEVKAARPTDEALLQSLGKNISDYELLDWLREVQSYYNSTVGITLMSHANSTSSNVPNFISSVLLTKEDLPNGTVIIVDEGYQYRPEGWVNETTKNASDRPANVIATCVVITDEWWGKWTIRAFNLSAIAARKMLLEDVEHLRIYVPKS